MQGRIFISMIDLAFLSLAAVIAILSQTQLIQALPIEVTEIGQGIAAVTRDEVTVVTITDDEILVDGEPVSLHELGGAVDGPMAILRVGRMVPTERLIRVMAELAGRGVELRIEVRESSGRGSAGGHDTMTRSGSGL